MPKPSAFNDGGREDADWQDTRPVKRVVGMKNRSLGQDALLKDDVGRKKAVGRKAGSRNGVEERVRAYAQQSLLRSRKCLTWLRFK